MGSAYGGEWQPKKDEDKRFLGKPGEIKESQSKSGTRQLTKIGENGKAESERHFTDHGNPSKHTVPHDHRIDWSKGFPDPSEPINYPSGAPEFKHYKENSIMRRNIVAFDELAFESAAELKWLLSCRCEVEFIWKGKAYSITHFGGHHCICEGHYLKDGKAYNLFSHSEYDISNAFESDDLDEIMNFEIEGDKLRDIATKIGIVDRTL